MPLRSSSWEGTTFFFYPGVYTFTPVAEQAVDATPRPLPYSMSSIAGNTDGDASDVSLVATYNNNLKRMRHPGWQEVIDSCASIPDLRTIDPFAIQSDALTAVFGENDAHIHGAAERNGQRLSGARHLHGNVLEQMPHGGTRDVDTAGYSKCAVQQQAPEARSGWQA